MTRAPKAAALSLLAACALVLVTGAPALAHTQLLSSTPPDGSTVGRAPAEVALHFSEGLDPRFVRIAVRAPGGSEAAQGRPSVSGSVVRQRMDPRAAGTYTLSYRVVSADGHPVSDSLAFTATSEQAATGVPRGVATSPSLAATSRSQDPSQSPAMFAVFAMMLAAGMGVLVIRSRPRRGGTPT
ncbi:MAG: copper resistance protein CopC [Actinomycetia bacterium]|jgi:methionine-rich copper-binding protein CopC|nr:copper resistance protein CopC [Actinomycetes bacterium]